MKNKVLFIFSISLCFVFMGVVKAESPDCTVVSTNNVASTQTVTLNCTGTNITELKSYVPSANGISDSTESWNSGRTNLSKEYTLEYPGDFRVEVTGGSSETTVITKTFYKTTFDMLYGTVSPLSVLTMKDNSFNLPTPSINSGYDSSGNWYTNLIAGSGAIAYDTLYTPTSSQTFYSSGVIDISKGIIVLSSESFVYNGTNRKPTMVVAYNGDKLTKDKDYSYNYYNNKNVGKAYVEVVGKGSYVGFKRAYFTITKASNPMTITIKKKTVKVEKVKKKKQVISAIKVSKAQGKVVYTKVSGSKKVTINPVNGKITLKKKSKKGTYKVKVLITADGNSNYYAAGKTVTVKIKVQ